MTTLLEYFEQIQSNFKKKLQDLESRVDECEKLAAKTSERVNILEEQLNSEQSEDKLPYVFKAPHKNQFFCGRNQELEKLQCILRNDDPGQENVVRIAAVCGLGGIGKTSLVTECAHQMKEHYYGGVYWFSAEDETFFQESVIEIADKIGCLSIDNFDLTLAKTINRIGKANKPCLIVLDCLDERNLSRSIIKFLSLVSRECSSTALVLISRRNKSLLVEDINLNLREDYCLSLKCLGEREGKQFLSHRTGLTLDELTERDATSLVHKLGGLPLALEQAGACIKAIRCDLSDYLEKYDIEHLKLLGRRKAKPLSENESPERLAVNTTWLLNFKHIKQCPGGAHATLLMNAYAFLNPDEIEQELVNIGQPPIEDKNFAKSMKTKFDRRQVVKLLTDFSLFTYVHARSISTHRLVQELVRENLTPQDATKSFVHSVRLLSFVFFKCEKAKSPRALLGCTNITSQDLPKSHSDYLLWSKLAIHGLHLLQNMENLLENLDSKLLKSLFVFEAAEILHECAVYLSVNSKHMEAKRTLNLAYRIIDWIPSKEHKTVVKRLSAKFFSRSVIPVPKRLQITIRNACTTPMSTLRPIEGRIADGSESHDLEKCLKKLRDEGNKYFKEGQYVKAVEAYTDAIDRSRDTHLFDPLLLTNRASAFVKLNQPEDALKNANEYISQYPFCWRGYSRKALALLQKDDKDAAEMAAALAHYYNLSKKDSRIFIEYEPFKQSFQGLEERIRICDSVSQFESAIRSNNSQDCLRIIVLGSKEYSLNRNNQLTSVHDANQTKFLAVKNCIVVGAQQAESKVTFNIDGSKVPVFCEKCLLVNLSFSLARGQIICHSESTVTILDCNFASGDDTNPAVVSRGVSTLERCKFTNCQAGGLICEELEDIDGSADVEKEPTSTVVDNCTFSDNMGAGIVVQNHGILTVRNSRIYNNKTIGLIIGPKAAKCEAFNCQIYNNSSEGILVIEESKGVTLMRNQISENDENGIMVKNSEVDLIENKINDNEAWGIWSQNNSRCNILMNDVFRNKLGGVRDANRSDKDSSTEVVLNTFHDNFGPGFFHTTDDSRFRMNRIFGKSAENQFKCSENKEYNNEERLMNQKYSSSRCSRCFQMCAKLKLCQKCLTSGYCGEKCEKEDTFKHKRLCNVLRKKSSLLLTPVSPPVLKKEAGILFVGECKINFISTIQKDSEVNLVFDGIEMYENDELEVLRNLVKEFGILSERKEREKQLYLYAVFEDNGFLRVFINDIADFQNF